MNPVILNEYLKESRERREELKKTRIALAEMTRGLYKERMRTRRLIEEGVKLREYSKKVRFLTNPFITKADLLLPDNIAEGKGKEPIFR